MEQKRDARHRICQAGRDSGQSLGRLLDSATLAPLLHKTDQLRRANDRLRARLGATLGNNWEVANRRGDTLVLMTDSAAWASRLRFLAPQILKALSDAGEGSGLRRLKVVVRPKSVPPSPLASRRLALSERSAGLLREVARDTQDPALREALLRLSHRCKPAAQQD